MTGATGFLGSWLAKSLVESGASVVTIVRDEVPGSNFYRFGLDRSVAQVRGDITNYFVVERTLNEYEIDTCFHLAAQPLVTVAYPLPLSTFESNIKGTWNVLEAARRYGKLARLVVASSDKAYGSHQTLPYTEHTALMGEHPYEASKSCADLLSRAYALTYAMPIAVARCGNFYGGGDLNWSRIVPGTFRSIARGERPVIRSNGELQRDYLYIEDAVRAYLTLAEALDRREIHGEAFNFGAEEPVRVTQIVHEMLAVGARPDLQPVYENHASNEIAIQYLSCTKARQMLGWTPLTPRIQGLQAAGEWYHNFFNTM